MKAHLFLLGFICLVWAGLCPAPPIPVCPDCIAPVFDNGPASASGEPLPSGEYVTSGDFDGDGRTDILLLDKATGVWRRGVGAAGPGFAFDQARPSGTEQITAMTAGHFRQEGLTSVVVASPSMNRVQVIADGPSSFADGAQPNSLGLPAAGPMALAAVDVPSTGNTTLPEVALVTEAGTGTDPIQRHVLRAAQTGGLYHDTSGAQTRRALRLSPVVLDAVGTYALGAVTDGGLNSQRFELWQPSNGNFTTTSAIANLPLGSRFISGLFEGTNPDVIFFVQGSASVRVVRVAVDGSGNASLQAVQIRALARNVRALYPLTRSGTTAVLALYTDDTAAVLSYTQASGFSSGQSLPAGAFTLGAVPLLNGDFVMLTGDASDPSARSTHAHRYSYNAATGNYDLTWSSALPSARPQRAAGNVQVFNQNPLASPDAQLVRSAQVRDWTRNLQQPGGLGLGDLTLQAESYLNKADGLGNTQPATLASFMSGTETALGNQTTDAVSLFTFDSALGDRIDDVVADPPGGSFDRSVSLALHIRDTGATIYWRKGSSGPFTVFPGQAWLVADTTVEYYGRSVGGLLTPRHTSSYHFTRTPKEQDADGDGVPDFVEIAFGLDPNGTISGDGSPADFDNDGWSDLDEILAGANPGGTGVPALADPAAHPDFDWHPPSTDQQLKIWVKPRCPGTDGTVGVAAVGTVVEAHDTTGALLAKAPVVGYSDGSRWAHLTITEISDAQRIVILSTQPHFEPGPEPWPEPEPSLPSGREVLGYVRIPTLTPMTFTFEFDPIANPTTQAQNWVNARRNATGNSRTQPVVALDYLSTLKLHFLERMLRDLAPMRGISFSGSLTPFRDTAQAFGTPGFSADQIAQLESAPSTWSTTSDIRAWKFSTLLDTADAWITNPTPQLAVMQQAALKIYQISAALSNAHPGVYAPPASVLHEWVQHGVLDSAYQSQISGINPTDLMSAAFGFYTLTFAIPKRPVFEGVGNLYGGSDIDSTSYTAFTSNGTTYNLRTASGSAYQWPGTFGFTTGTPLRVIAFNDTGSAEARTNLEVIRGSIESLTLAQAPDADGNLLPDAWELFYFGDTGQNALGNRDGSGYSLLQEYLDGTNPTTSADSPAGAPTRLELANLRLDWSAPAQPGGVCVRWTFPSAFGPAFHFAVQSSTDLQSFAELPLQSLEETPGNFCMTIPQVVGPRGFFRVVPRVK